ncbi:hypothetical protein [Desulfovibrio gilichinskyi]|uniref:Uncharacterized protein n=1 Tax=Desulfovibrio gilichinskyi TaxID=1519643 RepID=A0A1X7E5T0_9BACT|nr:hypothetical protein [Desulfovibrio gilichinskyi]SMF27926.1 hypothetical protein SAMN06295933_2683 [Desulfovibrio gilichinskyi]
MQIDASALKSTYGATSWQDSRASLLGGSRTFGVGATRLNVSAPPVNTAEQFADLIAQKTVSSKTSGAEAQKGALENGQSSKDPSELAGALAEASNFIESEFGKDAATAFKGIVIANSGDTVTEESLSNGLLQSIQFIDRNFGFSAGDKVMDHFNANLNNVMNNHFENGLQEHFFAAKPGTAAKINLSNTFAKLNEEFGTGTSEAIESMIDQIMKTKGNSLSSFKEGLEKALEKAEELHPGITAQAAPDAAGELMDQIQNSGYLKPPAKGSVLNLSV